MTNNKQQQATNNKQRQTANDKQQQTTKNKQQKQQQTTTNHLIDKNRTNKDQNSNKIFALFTWSS